MVRQIQIQKVATGTAASDTTMTHIPWWTFGVGCSFLDVQGPCFDVWGSGFIFGGSGFVCSGPLFGRSGFIFWHSGFGRSGFGRLEFLGHSTFSDVQSSTPNVWKPRTYKIHIWTFRVQPQMPELWLIAYETVSPLLYSSPSLNIKCKHKYKYGEWGRDSLQESESYITQIGLLVFVFYCQCLIRYCRRKYSRINAE